MSGGSLARAGKIVARLKEWTPAAVWAGGRGNGSVGLQKIDLKCSGVTATLGAAASVTDSRT